MNSESERPADTNPAPSNPEESAAATPTPTTPEPAAAPEQAAIAPTEAKAPAADKNKPVDEAVGAEGSIEAQMEAALEKQMPKRRKKKGGGGRPRGGPRGGERSAEPRPTTTKGTVVRVAGNDVFVEMGPRSQGLCSLAEFEEAPGVGEEFDFLVHGQGEDGLVALVRHHPQVTVDWSEIEVGSQVELQVAGQNTGGLELKIGSFNAFMPASHVGLSRIEDLSQFIGQKMICKVLECDPRRKRVLVSRRAVLEVEVRAQRGEEVKSLSIGQILKGTIKRFETFGAFVELKPGVEGLLHVSNISRKRVNDPRSVLSDGQEIEVQILDIKEGGRRIGLGMKQLEANPWNEVVDQFPVGTMHTGKVTRIATFGAFVAMNKDIEGLVHISQLASERIRTVGEVAKVGEDMQLRIVSVDPEQERLALSRLDKRGRVIGSVDEAEDDSDFDIVRDDHEPHGTGTNLGDLLRRALED
ncbi:MAG: S1 RNA-binding domain-containing protein [Planctomycetota bacterium]